MTTKTQKSHKMTTKRCKHGHHEAQSDHTSTMTTTKRCLMITKNNKWTTKRHKTHYKEKRKTFKETENHYKNVENDHTGMQKRLAKLKDLKGSHLKETRNDLSEKQNDYKETKTVFQSCSCVQQESCRVFYISVFVLTALLEHLFLSMSRECSLSSPSWFRSIWEECNKLRNQQWVTLPTAQRRSPFHSEGRAQKYTNLASSINNDLRLVLSCGHSFCLFSLSVAAVDENSPRRDTPRRESNQTSLFPG